MKHDLFHKEMSLHRSEKLNPSFLLSFLVMLYGPLWTIAHEATKWIIGSLRNDNEKGNDNPTNQ